MSAQGVMILGGGGRVGMQIVSELLCRGFQVILLDIQEQNLLEKKAGRLLNDARLATDNSVGKVSVYGGIDALDKNRIIEILATEKPDLVINYAIPITWDATKRLPNYSQVSAAGLGAFTPIQVWTPLLVAQAIAEAGIDCKYMVGNLPDITVPIITGIAQAGDVQLPLAGAGNVGLNQVAFRSQIALERGVEFADVELSLVSHHVHWVAPREPGYSNEGPFLARVVIEGVDVTDSFEDLRAVMNRGVDKHYEAEAAFSSTTGILASRVALALLDESGASHCMHTPAPNGLPGGYPVKIENGAISVDLPDTWSLDSAIVAMQACHRLDGVQDIEPNGTVHFTDIAQVVLREELGIELPAVLAPADIPELAQHQIEILRRSL
jgi:hypothetical protein